MKFAQAILTSMKQQQTAKKKMIGSETPYPNTPTHTHGRLTKNNLTPPWLQQWLPLSKTTWVAPPRKSLDSQSLTQALRNNHRVAFFLPLSQIRKFLFFFLETDSKKQ